MKYNKKKMSLKEKIKSCFMTEIEEQLENINGEISSKKEKLNSLKKEILELKYSVWEVYGFTDKSFLYSITWNGPSVSIHSIFSLFEKFFILNIFFQLLSFDIKLYTIITIS